MSKAAGSKVKNIHFYEIGRNSETHELEITRFVSQSLRSGESYRDKIREAVRNGEIPNSSSQETKVPHQLYEAHINIKAQSSRDAKVNAYVLFLNVHDDDEDNYAEFGPNIPPFSHGGQTFEGCAHYLKEICTWTKPSSGKQSKSDIECYSEHDAERPSSHWVSFIVDCSDHGPFTSLLNAPDIRLLHEPTSIFIPLFLNLFYKGFPVWISASHLNDQSICGLIRKFAERCGRGKLRSKYPKGHEHRYTDKGDGPVEILTHGGPHPDIPRVFVEIDLGS